MAQMLLIHTDSVEYDGDITMLIWCFQPSKREGGAQGNVTKQARCTFGGLFNKTRPHTGTATWYFILFHNWLLLEEFTLSHPIVCWVERAMN